MKTQIIRLLFLCIMLSICIQTNAADLKRPKILGISHLSVYAKDIENTKSLYTNFLGFDAPFAQQSSTFKINDKQFVSVFQEENAEADRFLNFGIETDDAELMRKYIASKGYKVPDKVTLDKLGNQSFVVKDPVGNNCQIIQYLPKSEVVKTKGKNLPTSRVSTSIKHVGMMVSNLNADLEFYRDVLGFQEIWRGSMDSVYVSWVHMKVPDGDQFIELSLYNLKLTKGAKGSMNHICLEVDSLPVAVNTLKNRILPSGCRLDKPRVGTNHKRQMNLFDADGTRIEIMEKNTFDGKKVASSTLPPKKSME